MSSINSTPPPPPCHYRYTALKLDSDTKQIAKPILCDTDTLKHIDQGLPIVLINDLRNYVKSDNIMTTCLTLMPSNISDAGVMSDLHLRGV